MLAVAVAGTCGKVDGRLYCEGDDAGVDCADAGGDVPGVLPELAPAT